MTATIATISIPRGNTRAFTINVATEAALEGYDVQLMVKQKATDTEYLILKETTIASSSATIEFTEQDTDLEPEYYVYDVKIFDGVGVAIYNSPIGVFEIAGVVNGRPN